LTRESYGSIISDAIPSTKQVKLLKKSLPWTKQKTLVSTSSPWSPRKLIKEKCKIMSSQ
jgi:hypothetical protein